jgi:hypothetical protein
MARKSITQLLQESQGVFPIKTNTLINPLLLKNLITNILDTFRPAYAAIDCIAGAVISATAVDQPWNWQTIVAAQAPEWIVSLIGGICSRESENGATTRVSFTADVVAPNNTVVTFTLYLNGVATPWAVSTTSTSSADIQSIAMGMLVYSAAATAVYQMMVKINVPGNVTISNAAMVCENVPVANFT